MNSNTFNAIFGRLESLCEEAKREVKENIEKMTEKLLTELEKELKVHAPSDPRTRKNKLRDSFKHESETKRGVTVWKLKHKTRQGNKLFLVERGHRVGNVKKAHKKTFVEGKPFFDSRKEKTKHEYIRRVKALVEKV